MSSLTPWRQGDGRRGDLSRHREHPLDLFHREFDALFDRFFGGAMSPFEQENFGRAGWGFDVAEEGNETAVRADLPGFEPDDIDVRLDNGVLTVQAEEKG